MQNLHLGNTTITRRNMLGAAGAGAIGAALVGEMAERLHAQENLAAGVEDRGADIRITALRGFRVGAKAYVKIETNRKIIGWGEVTGLDPHVAVALAKSLFELLDGENPTRVEHLWQKLYRAHRDMRGGPFMTHVLSAIDMALWDITGRCWGVPVYRLLGGPTRDKIRLYPNAKAHKIGTGGPHPESGSPAEVKRMVDQVRQHRERLGPEGLLMFDAHSAMPPAMLIQFANAVEPYDLLFIEEPAVPGNADVFRRIREQVRVPLATGERERTIWGFLPLLQNRSVDILQPDCGHTGGISQMKKIAALAEAFFVPLAPHCTMSELGLSASLHVTASVPLFLIHEAYLDGHLMPAGVARKNWDVDKEGYASLPQGPGLGVEIDESMFDKVNADPKRKYQWPSRTSPDGAIRDY
jgi:galactonate dehydratase